jgi:hypothetical protein
MTTFCIAFYESHLSTVVNLAYGATDHKAGLKIPTLLNVRKRLAISSL